MKGKKLISVLLSMAMFLSLFSFSALAENAQGDGTAESPYLITEGGQLAALLTDDSTQVFHIVSDIELPSTYVPVAGFKGQLIGYNADGTAEEMRTIKVNISGAGLFASAKGAFQIKNITLDGSVTGTVAGTGGFIGIASSLTASTVFENCVNKAEVSNTANVAKVGGFIGEASSSVTNFVMKNCVNEGSVTGKNTMVGGIVGYAGALTIEKSANEANVKSTNTAYGQVGGLVGYAGGTKVNQCYNIGSISGQTEIGGIIGRYHSFTAASYFTNNFNAGAIEAKASASKAGGLVGNANVSITLSQCYNSGKITAPVYDNIAYPKDSTIIVTKTNCYYLAEETDPSTGALSDKDMKDENKYNGFDSTIWGIIANSNYSYMNLKNNPYSIERDGSSELPFVIDSKEEFLLIGTGSYGVDKNYILTSDITLDSSYVPVANFSGTLIGYNADGTSEEMRTINVNISGSGLFESATGAFKIKNITLSGSVTDTDESTGGFVGSVAQTAAGAEISNCINNAVISNTGNVKYVGGIVGNAASELAIINCHNKKSVTGKNHDVGGIIGYTSSAKVVISKCSNTAEVKTTNSAGVEIGGIVGYSSSPISECFNTGNISGSSNVGGIAGRHQNTQKITNCFNTADIITTKADGNAGGIVGYTYNKCEISCCYNTGSAYNPILGTNRSNYAPTMTSVYYRAETADSTTGALTSTQMKNEGSYAGFDSAIWDIISDTGYPYMNLISNKYTVERDGSEEYPYLITSYNDLVAINEKGLNKVYLITNNITIPADHTPITGFSGTLMCDENDVKTITFENSSTGLFATITGNGSVKNLNLAGNIKYTAAKTGAVVGSSTSATATLENIASDVTITKADSLEAYLNFIGGLAGEFKGNITNCVNTGEIYGLIYVGGIVGDHTGGTISGCSNTAQILADTGRVGGIAGRSYSTADRVIEKCYNTGYLADGYMAGGIVGECIGAGKLTIDSCYNIGGAVYDSFAGIMGKLTTTYGGSAVISNCYSTGANGSDSYVYTKPITATNENVTITNCYYLGFEDDKTEGTTSFTNEGIAEVLSALGSNFVDSENVYIYPQISGNINDTAAPVYYVVSLKAEGEGGKVSPEKMYCEEGKSAEIKYTISQGYELSDIRLNDMSISYNTSGGVYETAPVEGNCEYVFVFTKIPEPELISFLNYDFFIIKNEFAGLINGYEEIQNNNAAVVFAKIINGEGKSYGIAISSDYNAETPESATWNLSEEVQGDTTKCFGVYIHSEGQGDTYYAKVYQKNADGEVTYFDDIITLKLRKPLD